MIWMGISSKGTSDIYVHKSIQVLNQETYLKECINKRLLSNIIRMEIICFGQKHITQILFNNVFTEKNLPFVSRVDNPSNIPQARSIETERYMKTIVTSKKY